MTELAATPKLDDTALPEADVLQIGQAMSRMRLLTGRRLIGRLAIDNIAPGLELTHLDVLDGIRRAASVGEVTVGTVADIMRIDPSRASRIVAEMVSRGVLRRKASQADARRIVITITSLGHRLIREIQAQKHAVIESIVADWPAADVEAFAELFDRFVGCFERMFAPRA